MHFYGDGWVLWELDTQEQLLRELANDTDADIVCANYTRSPDPKYPIAIEQAYAATNRIAENGNNLNVNTSKLAVVSDSVEGNMAATVIIHSKERGGPTILFQILFYPVTNASFDPVSF